MDALEKELEEKEEEDKKRGKIPRDLPERREGAAATALPRRTPMEEDVAIARIFFFFFFFFYVYLKKEPGDIDRSIDRWLKKKKTLWVAYKNAQYVVIGLTIYI